MEDDSGASFRERFRQARQERGRDRAATSSKVTLKRRRGDASSPEAPPLAKKESRSEPESEQKQEVAEGGLSKDEMDRILMPPPGPLRKESKSSSKQHSPEGHSWNNASQTESVGGVPSAATAVANGSPLKDNGDVPEDFFEEESKRAMDELEKERTVQRTNAEYVRFQKELEGSLDAMNEEEAQEEEESELHRQERDAYEQQQRFKIIENMKEQRRSQSTTTKPSNGLSASKESNHEASSSDEDDAETQWRGKAV